MFCEKALTGMRLTTLENMFRTMILVLDCVCMCNREEVRIRGSRDSTLFLHLTPS